MSTEPLWGGRFSKPPEPSLMQFTSSVEFDKKLWRQDLTVASAHARALERAGLLSAGERVAIEEKLALAAQLFEAGTFVFNPSDEDIHSAVERFLTEQLGEVGAKIHAGRSRNDLVATDLRLWIKQEAGEIARGVFGLEEALYRQAQEHAGTLAPGFTHLQRAQPVVLAHLLLAHAFALCRDFERLVAAHRRADVSPLGAAAFAGTSLPTDARAVAADLGFAKVFDNAADAVSDRDFAIEFLAAGAMLGMHLSRLGEEIVLWTSAEFGFASLDDSYATGSSIMPQKKNPDVAELARAKASRLLGNLVHLLGAMKGIPLAYNRDLQEDKEPVFDTAACLRGCLAALRGAVQTMTFDKARLEAAASGGFGGAADLAEALTARGVAFREAHECVGRLVALAASRGEGLADLSAKDLAAAHPLLGEADLEGIEPSRSVSSRRSHGGTAPERIAEQIAALEAAMDDHERWLSGFALW